MIIQDRVYGRQKIKEPVLLALIKSKSVQRLKNISQFGVPDKFNVYQGFSRYEHSIGVMLLLRKSGANLEEQAAGLLHDASILAFSHIADWVFGDGKKGVEGYHDKLHIHFISQTEIPGLLKKYNLNADRISEINNFSLLENSIPNLCADRIDYALREFEKWQNPGISKAILKKLVNLNGEFVFLSKKEAFIFASNFLKLQIMNWGGEQVTRRQNLFANTLNLALRKKLINRKDFFKDEKSILKKIEESTNKIIIDNLKQLKSRSDIKSLGRQKVLKKFRYVDPKILYATKLLKLSEVDINFKRLVVKFRKINLKGIYV